eukprot:gene7621-11944_t
MDDFLAYHHGVNKRKWDTEPTQNIKKPKFETKTVHKRHDRETLEKFLFPNQKLDDRSTEKLIKQLSKLVKSDNTSNFPLIFDYLNSIILTQDENKLDVSNELLWKLFVNLYKSDDVKETYFPNFSFWLIFQKITLALKNKKTTTQLLDYFIEILEEYLLSSKTNQFHDNKSNIDEFIPSLISSFSITSLDLVEKFQTILDLSLKLLKSQYDKILEKEELYKSVMNLVDSLFLLYCKTSLESIRVSVKSILSTGIFHCDIERFNHDMYFVFSQEEKIVFDPKSCDSSYFLSTFMKTFSYSNDKAVTELVDFILLEYTTHYRAFNEQLKKQNIQFRSYSSHKMDVLFFNIFLEACIQAQKKYKSQPLLLTKVIKVLIVKKLSLSIQHNEKFNTFTKYLVDKMSEFSPNSQETLNLVSIFGDLLRINHDFSSTFLDQVMRIIFQMNENSINSPEMNQFFIVFLKNYVAYRRLDTFIEGYAFGTTKLKKPTDSILKSETFRKKLFEEFSKLPGGQIIQIFELFIKIITTRIEEDEKLKKSNVIPLILCPFITFIFSIKLRDINYKSISGLANETNEKIVYPILKKLMKDIKKDNQFLFSSVLQLYYACKKIITDSEEFSSEVYTFKTFKIQKSDAIIQINDEKKFRFDTFNKNESLSEFMKNETVSLSAKVVLCHIIYLRMNEISKQLNIRKHNLITSSENLQDVSSKECKDEIEYLTNWYHKYFNILEMEFSNTVNLFSSEVLTWNGLIETVTEENYVAILWKLFTTNIRVLGDFISKENFFQFTKFLLKRLTITQHLKSKELYFTSPYDVNITTTFLMKRKAFFDLTIPRDCVFLCLVEDVSKEIMNLVSLFHDDSKDIKKSTDLFVKFVGKDLQHETNNFNSIIKSKSNLNTGQVSNLELNDDLVAVLKNFPTEYFSERQIVSLIRLLFVEHFYLNLMLQSKINEELESKIIESQIKKFKIILHLIECVNLKQLISVEFLKFFVDSIQLIKERDDYLTVKNLKIQLYSLIISQMSVNKKMNETSNTIINFMIKRLSKENNISLSECFLISLANFNKSKTQEKSLIDGIKNFEPKVQMNSENKLSYLCSYLGFHRKINSQAKELGVLFTNLKEFLSTSNEDEDKKYSTDILMEFFSEYCTGYNLYEDESVFNLQFLFNALLLVSKNVKHKKNAEIGKLVNSVKLEAEQYDNLLEVVLKHIQISCQRAESSLKWRKLISHTTVSLNLYEIIFKNRLIKPHLIAETMKVFADVVVIYSSIDVDNLKKNQIQQTESIIQTTLEMMNNRISSIASAFSKIPQYFTMSVLPQILTILMNVAQSENIMSIESYKLVCDNLRTCANIHLFSLKNLNSLFFIIKFLLKKLFIFTTKQLHDGEELLIAANYLGRVYSFLSHKSYKAIHHSVVQNFLIESSKDLKSQKIIISTKTVIDTLITVGMLNLVKSMDSKTINEVFSSLPDNMRNEKNLLYEIKDRVASLKSYQ